LIGYLRLEARREIAKHHGRDRVFWKQLQYLTIVPSSLGDVTIPLDSLVAQPFYESAVENGLVVREQRKLVTIMAADVVGYSRPMGRDESGTLTLVRYRVTSGVMLSACYSAFDPYRHEPVGRVAATARRVG
jgi:hypothetical protein